MEVEQAAEVGEVTAPKLPDKAVDKAQVRHHIINHIVSVKFMLATPNDL